jgi:Na+-driven multidrug efflux pump
LQDTGNSLLSTIAQLSGAVANIILDPIMIYGLLGCPEFGVKGAAYATIIGQIISAVLAFIFHLTVNKNISKSVKYIKPSGKIIGEIYKIGLPAIIAQALMSLMTYGLNIILGNIPAIGENMVTAYGLYYKVQQFILFAAFGLRDAITPIISYSFGMKSKSRITDGIKYGMIYTLVIMLIGLAVIEALAVPFSEIFGLSGQTEDLCISAMRIVSISFIFAGANIAFQGIFQALGGGIESLVVSVCRQFIFVLPVAWGIYMIVSDTSNAWLLWITFPIAEFV